MMVRPPAGFMRGVPENMTWGSQMRANSIGIARYNALQSHIDRYAAPIGIWVRIRYGGFGGGFR